MNIAFEIGRALIKRAGVSSEAAGYLTSPVSGIPGALAGIIKGPYTPEEQLEAAGGRWSNLLVPGVGGYRLGRRMMTSAREGDSTSGLTSEILGGITAPLLATALGGGLGYLVEGKKGLSRGIDLGRIGSSIGHLSAIIAALVKKRRTDPEQAEYERGSHILNYLVPGLGPYHLYKRLGHTMKHDIAAADFARKMRDLKAKARRHRAGSVKEDILNLPVMAAELAKVTG